MRGMALLMASVPILLTSSCPARKAALGDTRSGRRKDVSRARITLATLPTAISRFWFDSWELGHGLHIAGLCAMSETKSYIIQFRAGLPDRL